MKRIRYTMPARSQGNRYMQRATAEKDVHRWLVQRLDNVHCDLQCLNPHTVMCGWPFCLDDLDGADDMEGGAI